MTASWEPGTSYGHGDKVRYNGHTYKIIQPHTSQSDWTPSVTPALWGKCQDEEQPSPQPRPNNQAQQQWQQPLPPSYDPGKQEQGYPQSSSGTSNISNEKKHWYDGKENILIGGGIAAAAGLLGGGLLAYKHHQDSKSEDEWLATARANTAAFNQNGHRGPATWVLNHGKSIPQGAIVVGKEHNWTLYICRAYQGGGVQLGKASDVFKKGAVIGYKNDEIHLDTYEILIGDMRGLRWVEARDQLHVSSLGARPVEGGFENDGTPLYIAKAFHNDVWHPGKASEKLDGAYIPYDGKEKKIQEYQVLCYA